MSVAPEDQTALAVAVREIESHLAGQGWDQPGRLYALVDTAELVAREPALADTVGLDGFASGSLTAVEQDELPPGDRLEDVLDAISWPGGVTGCAAAVERLVLPPGVDDVLPGDPAGAAAYASSHPERQEVRIVVGVTRTGASYCALRMRAHDEDGSVVTGTDLVPGLVELLGHTLSDDHAMDDLNRGEAL